MVARREPETDPDEVKRIFTEIYHKRSWGSESASGIGSTRERAADFLEPLIAAVRNLEIALLLDAPCGDFAWAAPLADAVDQYVGVDIVDELIRRNRSEFAGGRRTFLSGDILHDRLPRCDAVLCRDCLVHFRHADVWRALASFKSTGARILIATTFSRRPANEDISTGGWSPLNLQAPPFGFPEPLQVVDERCLHTGGIYSDKVLAFWRLQELPDRSR